MDYNQNNKNEYRPQEMYFSPVAKIKGAFKGTYELAKDIVKGVSIATNGTYSRSDAEFARNVGIKPRYKG